MFETEGESLTTLSKSSEDTNASKDGAPEVLGQQVEEQDPLTINEGKSPNEGNPIESSNSVFKGEIKQTVILRRNDPLRKESDWKKWILPWSLCKTWSGFHELVRQAFHDDTVSSENLANGKFDLHGPNGDIVIPQVWESLAEPGWEITIVFTFPPMYGQFGRSVDPPDPDKDNDGVPDAEVIQETSYDEKIKYTVDFYVSSYRGESSFRCSQDYDGPPLFNRSVKKPKTLPVLQETIELVRQLSGFAPPHSFELPKREASSKREAFSPGDKVRMTKLVIHSPFLLNALRTVIAYSSLRITEEKDSLREGIFPYPYEDLYHYKDALLDYKKNHHPTKERHTEEYNTECDRHIDVLIDYLYSQQKVNLRQAEERWSREVPTTTFHSFWLLMKPGSDVYIKEHGLLNSYVVEGFNGGVSESGKPNNYTVLVWNLAFNGTHVTRVSQGIEVPVFDGEREISSLPVFPIRFHERGHGASLREELLQRGKKYFDLVKGPAFRSYTGLGLDTGLRRYEQARVIVDHKRSQIVTSHSTSEDSEDMRRNFMYDPHLPDPMMAAASRSLKAPLGSRARSPACQCDNCEEYKLKNQPIIPLTYASYDNIDPRRVGELSEHQYIICHSHLYAYVLKDRVYDRLDVSQIVEPKINVHAIDKLVMRTESNKAAIKAICQAYCTEGLHNQPFTADFIQGKGEGQIILLHGPPGTGKTLTAESVAEFTKRPLLSITAADLGHEPQALERNLLTFFRDADAWGAIVLLDEADVYLERRSVNEVKRNSIVSIFLRALEYFRGILFLTTNRVGSFDEAFLSRIHIQISYDPLDDSARSQIWDNSFRKLKEDHDDGGREIRYRWEAKEYVQKSSDVKELRWNGREIRNAFQTAVALAVYEARDGEIPFVKEEHLKQVVSMSSAFKDYMRKTNQSMENSEIAYKRGLRYDFEDSDKQDITTRSKGPSQKT